MKGLIINNFYSVGSTLKWTIGISIIINIAVMIGAVVYPTIIDILPVLMLAQIGAFVGLIGTALQKDSTSKWSKFERTLPVRVCDIIKARYISFLIFSAIGVGLATITVVVMSIASMESMNFERVGYGYGFGITFALLVPAIMYPLILRFGADKSEILLMVSVLVVTCLFFAGSALIGPYLENLQSSDIIYRLGWITISVACFIGSYFISLSIYKRKQL
ncbi:MAG: ABC-2 transporter permease [Clostridium sp.]|uniref:ABC-2 transporter permease n=1 Tax=Clostridium sp. TaxID=1506 RepID=UPI002FC5EE75